MVKKYPARRRQCNPARAPFEQLHSDFPFQISNLPAQRGLSRMQPLGSGIAQAALFGYRNEITQMT
jgi:hypothetical protein